jgi:hypothetical protein
MTTTAPHYLLIALFNYLIAIISLTSMMHNANRQEGLRLARAKVESEELAQMVAGLRITAY